MITRGAWNPFTIQVALSMFGLLMTGAYILKGIGFTLHGELNPRWQDLRDMTVREHLVIWPLMLLMLSLGVWPRWLLTTINDTVTRLFIS
jgi:NADH-quinone oxidoreductase subunit M